MSDSSVEYYFADTTASRVGPLSESEFLQKRAENIIRPETHVWRTGESAWRPFSEAAEKWFPCAEPAGSVPPELPECISSDIRFGTILSDTWKILFSASNAPLLIAGGILWCLIDIVAAQLFLGIDIVGHFVTPIITMLVFLIFVRRWDRAFPTSFSDLFPLKQFFFKPWLRGLGATILSSLACCIPIIVACSILAIPVIETLSTDKNFKGELSSLIQRNFPPPAPPSGSEVNSSVPGTSNDNPESIDDSEIIIDAPEMFIDGSEIYPDFESIGTAVNLTQTVLEKPLTWICALFSIPFFVLAAYLWCRLMFAPYLCLDTHSGVINSMSLAWKLTSGKGFSILALVLLVNLIVLFGSILTLGLGFLVLVPYSHLFCALIYVKFVKARPELDIPATRL